MSKGQLLRSLVNQRLTAAAEEIFGLFERTIAEYEEELCCSKEENQRQRELLDAVLQPQLRLHRADVQPLSVSTEEVPSEERDWSLSLDQENPPESPHIKEEPEELWTSQEEAQLKELEEIDFTFTPFTVKNDTQEKSSQCHQPELMKPDEEECGGLEPARSSTPDQHLQFPVVDLKDCLKAQTEIRSDDGKAEDTRLGLKSIGDISGEKSFHCCECGRRFDRNSKLKRHMSTHSGEKPYSCSLCNKSFSGSEHSQSHMRIHTGEKPFCCSHCGERFTWRCQFKEHKCGGDAFQPQELWTNQGLRELEDHAGEKRFSCPMCNKGFTQKGSLYYHLKIHTGEKPFGCPVCGRTFSLKAYLQKHLKCHAGEKPYSCPVCKKSFSRYEHSQSHMRIHTGEKPFACDVCSRSFTWLSQLKRHKCNGGSSKLHEAWTNQDRGGPEDAAAFMCVLEKSKGGDQEEPQASRLHRDERMKVETDEEDCEVTGPCGNPWPESHGLTGSSFIGQFW